MSDTPMTDAVKTRASKCQLSDDVVSAGFASKLERQLAEARAEIKRLSRRLAEEIKWGHMDCVDGNCVASGIECPKQKEE